jgi:DNA-binding transcriptional ArsR family regulator
MRRRWAAVEARALGRGGLTRVSEATGLSRPTIRRGLRELRNLSKITFPFRGYNIFYESTERRGTYQFV